MKYLADLDLCGNLIKNVVVSSAMPANPVDGMIMYSTSAFSLLVYTRGKWESLLRGTELVPIRDEQGKITLRLDAAEKKITANADSIKTLKNRLDALLGSGGTGSLEDMLAGKQNKLTADSTVSLDAAGNIGVKVSANSGNALGKVADGLYVPKPAEYSVKKLAAPINDASATYQLTKDGLPVGDYINIPKDMVVVSGEVKAATEQDKAGNPTLVVGDMYIVLMLANKEANKLWIPAKSLVDEYTGDNVYVTVDNATNKVSLVFSKVKSDIDSQLVAPVRTTANAALPKSGGRMTGPIDMGGQTIRNFTSTADVDPITRGEATERIDGGIRAATDAAKAYTNQEINRLYTLKSTSQTAKISDKELVISSATPETYVSHTAIIVEEGVPVAVDMKFGGIKGGITFSWNKTMGINETANIMITVHERVKGAGMA